MSKGTRFRQKKSIKNWHEYNEGLKRRYDITLWLDAAVLAKPERVFGKKGRPPEYSDALIEMGLVLRGLYRLPLRGTEGMMRSILRLMGHAHAKLPDYTTLSRRSSALRVALDLMKRGHAIHLVVDTTGLKIYGEGEWKVRVHGASKRRTWRKLHLAIDEHTQEIIVADLTENSTGDQEHLPAIIKAVPEEIRVRQVSADGIYDTHECYDTVHRRGAKLVTPPRKNAVLPPPDTPPHPRHHAIRDCQEKGRKRWKKESEYHRRSLSETAMFRFKTTFGGNLAARKLPQQKTEAMVKVKTLNTLRKIAAPAYK
jgi:hypothetical protein